MKASRGILLGLGLTAAFSMAWATKAPMPAALLDFDFLLACLKENYAGYPDKVTADADKLAAFTALAKAQRERVQAHPDEAGAAMREVVSWFRDRHTGLDDIGPASMAAAASTPEALPSEGPRVDVDLVALEARARRQDAADGWSGLWETSDKQYRVAIEQPDPAEPAWRGIVLDAQPSNWSRGQVKFTIEQVDGGFTVNYYMRNHSAQAMRAALIADGKAIRFRAGDTFLWNRVGTTLAPEQMDRFLPSGEFFLRPLSPSTLWLRLPDFAIEHREEINALLERNAGLLRTTPNLVIDLRANAGGSDSSYRELMKWVCSHPVYTPAVEFRAGEETVRAYERILRDETALPESTRQLIGKTIGMMRERPGSWVMPFERAILGEPCSRLPSPLNVGILITGAGSSGDQFVIEARGSHKVTLFGQNTAGIIDYSNMVSVELPSGNHRLRYATSRSMRLPDEPLDNIGVPPDVPLGDDVQDQVGYVQRWLEARTEAQLGVK